MESGQHKGRNKKPHEDPASPETEEPRGIDRGIADADKKVRTGSKHEKVRNTPPAGAWNDTSAD